MKSSSRGCGTCKERRILCDRKYPECQECIRSKRTCTGYGLRLSWPGKNNRKRAMLGKASLLKSNQAAISTARLRIVHATIWDIEIHNCLTHSGLIRYPSILAPHSISPYKDDTNYNLLQYFDLVASSSLVACGRDKRPELHKILIQIALSQGSPYSSAVQKSLLAFSAIHRYGLHTYAVQLKQSALSTLTTLSKRGVEANEVIFHVATLMLLCCFEIQQTSETSSQWLCYISSIKSLLEVTQIVSVERDSGLQTLLYWVYYHDSLAQFSINNWKRPRLAAKHKSIFPREENISFKKTKLDKLLDISTSPCQCPVMLSMASEISNLFQSPQNERSPDLILLLEWKIRNLVSKTSTEHPASETETRTQEVFTLALLVYLERASGGTPETPQKLRPELEEAFHLFSLLETLPRLFPLLILGCEARSDEERMVVLDLISRTEESPQARNLGIIEEIIQSLWTQDDLADSALGYLEKMEAVLGSREVLLSFA